MRPKVNKDVNDDLRKRKPGRPLKSGKKELQKESFNAIKSKRNAEKCSILLKPVALSRVKLTPRPKDNNVFIPISRQTQTTSSKSLDNIEHSFTLRDFNGDDSIFEDDSFHKTFVHCCFCHQGVLSIPLFW